MVVLPETSAECEMKSQFQCSSRGFSPWLLTAYVNSTCLRFFSTCFWDHEPADNSSTWLELEKGCLFCSGRGSSLPNMLVARCYHRVIQVQSIYIFVSPKQTGSHTQVHWNNLNTHNLTWKVLPDMKEGRCYWCVYVCGSQLVEGLLRRLTASFLSSEFLEAKVCCLFVHNNQLVVTFLSLPQEGRAANQTLSWVDIIGQTLFAISTLSTDMARFYSADPLHWN